jgi:hypothetical protein
MAGNGKGADMISFYRIEKFIISQSIASAALWHCSLCGDCISGMGGPGNGTICERCGDSIMAGMFDFEQLQKIMDNHG